MLRAEIDPVLVAELRDEFPALAGRRFGLPVPATRLPAAAVGPAAT
ncbi:hypothetical protein GCM10022225_07070 [Plantactinospora mayteni]|uniref:Uncharacterized protein n=1 Tax=Plantactinospora mayteni TaxID=566021 RepID=A0ABQ4ER98_9ACTN|nr:hypothetical protein [Plantactinospora mayteni]GIG97195.1 hypothetical protein Pma05_37680 [Plantactinospora mayteni]